MYRRLFAAAGALALLTVSACSSPDNQDSDSGGAGTATTAGATTAAPSASAMAAQFGAGCAAVPTDPANPGSFDAMAKVPVATAASGNPVLSTLVTAVRKANLVDSLNGAQGITVFAPTDDAFGKIPEADLNKVLADDAMLKKVLTYHVVPNQLAPDELTGTHKTLQGGELAVTGSGTDFTVDGAATVVCGNVETANATVYIVDTVLMPKS